MPFELRARIGLDNSGLFAGLEQGKRAISGFRSHLGSAASNELSALKSQFAAAFGVAGIVSAIRSTITYAGEVDNLSQQLEISSNEAQEFMYVAQQTGSSVERVMRAMGKERKEFLLTQEQVNEKIKEFRDLHLGISEADIERLDAVGDKLDQISLRIKEIIASEATVGFLDFIDAALNSLGGDAAGKGKERANRDLNLFADALKGVFSEIAGGVKAKKKEEDVLHEASSPLSRARSASNQAFARQFDSLARIGGFMANTDQQRNQRIEQIAKDVSKIANAITGNLGAEIQNYL